MAHHHLSAFSLPLCNSLSSGLQPCMPPISLAKSRAVVHAQQTTPKTAFGPNSTNNNGGRRSADYKPAIWNFDHIQSLRNDYTGQSYERRANKLKEQVGVMLEGAADGDPLLQLQLIDMLQRLGLSYHFEDQIQTILNTIHNTNDEEAWKILDTNLYATALQFRLLRQHGYWVPQEVFNVFKDETGKFKACLSEDTEGMLSLYQASYYLIQGETILEEAKDFTTKHLKQYLQTQNNNKDQFLAEQVSHALELPLHWRVPRFETRWFIELYDNQQSMANDPILIELAKLDFNMLQAVYQEDLKYVFRWWRNSRLGENLSYARDRMMVSFLWTVGLAFEPELGYCRRMSAIVNAMITVIDDTYDVYGTLEELELFTNAVERWDVNAIDHLPDYMKLCFLTLHHSTNEIAFDVFKEQGIHIIKFLKNMWAGLCKAYLQEAKWYYSGYKPSVEEYIENACISISAPVILVHVYATATNPITEEALKSLDEYPNIVKWSGIVLRLANDLKTSPYEIQRGDVPKIIQCYMKETGASEADAREHIKFLVDQTWKKMNEYKATNSNSDYFSNNNFVERAMHLGRTAQYMYLYGDGHSIEETETKDRILSLFLNPIHSP